MAQYKTDNYLIDLSDEKTGFKQEAEDLTPTHSPHSISSSAHSANGSSVPSAFSPFSGRMRLPGFWKQEPELWFTHIEALFHTYGLHSDEERYYTVLAALETPEVLSQVADIVRSPPKENKYLYFKNQLISRFSASQERQLDTLLTKLSLANKKPTELLREMLKLAPVNTPETFIHSLWIQRMPTSVRCILSASPETNLTKLAEVADRILERSSDLGAVDANDTNPPRSTHIPSGMQQQIDGLERQLKELTIILKKQTIPAQSPRGRSDLHGGSQNLSHSDVSTDTKREICFYHQRFGEGARKCLQPCSFKTSPPVQTKN